MCVRERGGGRAEEIKTTIKISHMKTLTPLSFKKYNILLIL